MRLEITDEATALYVAVDPDGIWAKTTQPDELITVDWDGQGRVIGIEVIGAPAQDAIAALALSLLQVPAADPEALAEAVSNVLPGKVLADFRQVDNGLLAAVQAVQAVQLAFAEHPQIGAVVAANGERSRAV